MGAASWVQQHEGVQGYKLWVHARMAPQPAHCQLANCTTYDPVTGKHTTSLTQAPAGGYLPHQRAIHEHLRGKYAQGYACYCQVWVQVCAVHAKGALPCLLDMLTQPSTYLEAARPVGQGGQREHVPAAISQVGCEAAGWLPVVQQTFRCEAWVSRGVTWVDGRTSFGQMDVPFLHSHLDTHTHSLSALSNSRAHAKSPTCGRCRPPPRRCPGTRGPGRRWSP